MNNNNNNNINNKKTCRYLRTNEVGAWFISSAAFLYNYRVRDLVHLYLLQILVFFRNSDFDFESKQIDKENILSKDRLHTFEIKCSAPFKINISSMVTFTAL